MINSPEEYKNNLLKFDLQSFLTEYRGYNAINLKKDFPGTYRLLAAQLDLYEKANKKLPFMADNFCFFTSKSFEQASSEALANYKASLVQGDLLIDLSGGLGSDDIAFSGRFKNIISVDKDSGLNLLAEVNFSKMGINNIQRITSYAEEFISGDLKADLIYIDADRKTGNTGKKSVTLHDSSPDVLKILNRLFEISPVIMLKLSPLADITYLKRSLTNLKELQVISLKNEVKEILAIINYGYTNNASVSAIELDSNGLNILNKFSETHNQQNKPKSAQNGKYFIEAANALIKSGLMAEYAAHNNLRLVSPGSVFMITDTIIPNPFGRLFKIITSFPFSKSAFKKYLSEKNVNAANITCRNFPVKPDEIKLMFGLKDGGGDYFFFTSGVNKTKLVYHCRKLQ